MRVRCGCKCERTPKKKRKNFLFFRNPTNTKTTSVSCTNAALTHNHTPSPCFLPHILVVFRGLSCLKCYTWECVILNRFVPVVDPLLWTDRPVHLQLFFASVVTVPVLAHEEFIEASPENNKHKNKQKNVTNRNNTVGTRTCKHKQRECEKTSFC
jgi:hypothetical protein